MNYYMDKPTEASLKTQIAARIAHTAEMRTTREARHAASLASCEAKAALSRMQAHGDRFPIGGAE